MILSINLMRIYLQKKNINNEQSVTIYTKEFDDFIDKFSEESFVEKNVNNEQSSNINTKEFNDIIDIVKEKDKM